MYNHRQQFIPNCTEPPPNILVRQRIRSWHDVTVPPPTVPKSIGSRLLPWEDVFLSSRMPVPTQMRARSLTRLQREERRYSDNKHHDFEIFRQEHGEVPRYCNTCSEAVSYVHDEPTIITHNHQSSLKDRLNQTTDRWGQISCSSCKEESHSVYTGVRYPLLVTSSILNGWQGNMEMSRERGYNFHIETIGIPGAKVQDLHHAFVAEYANSEIPVDLLLVAGFNNLLEGQTADMVIDEMQHFKSDVLRIPSSTFAVSTLPLAPIISQLPMDNYVNEHRNHTEDMVEVNHAIRELNAEPGQATTVNWAPLFHTWGLRSVKAPKEMGPRRLLESLPAHQLNDWREQRPRNQLHLNQKVRQRMGRAVENYFSHIYNIKK